MSIKLIASDLDGSLLTTNKDIPDNFDEVLKKMKDKNIQFLIATGRSYYDVQLRFNKWIKDIIVIAENGNHIVYNEENLYHAYLEKDILKEIVQVTREIKKGLLVLCGLKHSYIVEGCRGSVDDQNELTKYYSEYVYINDIDEMDDDILKVTICLVEGTERYIYPHFKQFEDRTNVVVSAAYWVDITKINEDKGKALGIIQNKLNYSKDETICFGDYLNDLTLKDYVKHSYAMANGHEIIKKEYSSIIGSNDDFAVTNKIMELIEDM